MVHYSISAVSIMNKYAELRHYNIIKFENDEIRDYVNEMQRSGIKEMECLMNHTN